MSRHISLTWVVAAGILMVAATLSSAAEGNLLVSGGFEDGVGGGPAGWTAVCLELDLSPLVGLPPPRRSGGRLDAATGVAIEGSPFGFHTGNADGYRYLEELGAVWSREGIYAIWEWVDPDRNARFSFRNAIAPPRPGAPGSGGPVDYDAQWAAPPDWVRLVINLCPFRKGGAFSSDAEKATYQQFVAALVERYDGDADLGCTEPAPDCYTQGDRDRPSEATIAALAANPVRVWQVCNQVTDTCTGPGCPDEYAALFADVQRLSYEAVHGADEDALVLMAGDSAPAMYPPVFQALGGMPAMDVVDIHRFGEAGSWDPRGDLATLKGGLRAAGFDPDSFAFWITETGTYSGDPVDDRHGTAGPPFQSEALQAADLVKRYVAPIAAGVEKVFWAWNIVEGFGCDCCIFDYTGLVYDGNFPPEASGCDADDPYDRGSGVKKLAFYTMALLVQTLDGATAVATLPGTETARIYRFTKDGRSIWVVWSDAEGGETVHVNTGAATRVRITDAVPAAEYGEDIGDPATAFPTREETVSGSVVLDLGLSPVFVEQIG
jgi:hypothetical protein